MSIDHPNKSRGFSLIEIVLALGILSVTLVAIIGLISTSMQGDRESTEDTDLATMTQTAISLLHSEGFASVNANTNYLASDSKPDYFFDSQAQLICKQDGTPVTESDGAPNNALFGCVVTATVPPNSPSKLIFLQLNFTWPLNAPSTNQQHKIAITSLAEYDDF